MSAGTRVRLRLLGDFLLVCGGDPSLGILPARVQSLLAYLALHPPGQLRQNLAFLFWPDALETQARNSLRQLLHQLRRLWPSLDCWLSIDASRVAWQSDVEIDCDVDAFEEALDHLEQAERSGDDAVLLRDDLQRAVDLYRGDLLPGCYDEWLAPERERLRQAYGRTLRRLIAHLEHDGEYRNAIERAQELVRHDPLDEDAYRDLMRLHRLNGDRVSAMRTYHQCVSVLQRELEVEPGAATVAAYEQLLTTDRASATSTLVLRTRPAAAIPLIGRRREMDLLRSAWRDACAGAPGCVVLGGEPGIGKTRLAEELVSVAVRDAASAARSRAYAAEGHLAYGPIADWLRTQTFREVLGGLDARTLDNLARLLPELRTETQPQPGQNSVANPQQRQQFFASLAHAVLSAKQPLVLLLDDLQWCDQDTLEWLHYLLRYDPTARLLVVGTVRTEEVGAGHPFVTMLTHLRAAGQLVEVALGPLDASETAELAMCVARRAIDADDARKLHEETEGQPLFVIETIRARLGARESLSREVAVASVAHDNADSLEQLPPKVHAVIAARLADLSEPARNTLRLAATIGRSFSLELLIEATGGDVDGVINSLDELWRRQIVREHGTSAYDFSHDKIREVASSEMSPARRRLLHLRAAQALERISGVNLDGVSAQLAAHYEYAELPAQAAPYYQRAAEVAQRLHAHFEAIRLLQRELSLLALLPRTAERDAQELALQTALGTSHVATAGYGAHDAMVAYRRSRQLCHQLGKPPSAPVLRALAIAAIAHADFDQAQAFGDHLLSVASGDADPVLQVEGHYVLGVALFWKGALVPSRAHLEQALAYAAGDNLAYHLNLYAQDPRIVCQCRLAMDMWLLGYPDEAFERMAESLRFANALGHPFSLGYALNWDMYLHSLIGDADAVAVQADRCTTLGREHGMQMWAAGATIMGGWARSERGDCEAGIAQMLRGIEAHRATGSVFVLPFYLGLIAEQYRKLGRIERGLTLISEALAAAGRTGERWYEAELHRCRGGMLLTRGDAVGAELAFQRALDIARYQEAKAYEVRIATNLASLTRS